MWVNEGVSVIVWLKSVQRAKVPSNGRIAGNVCRKQLRTGSLTLHLQFFTFVESTTNYVVYLVSCLVALVDPNRSIAGDVLSHTHTHKILFVSFLA